MGSAHRPVLIFFLLSTLCLASSSPASPARKVPLALYYETLCPYCSDFIVNYLANIFNSGLISIVDLDLVPYGNAQIDSNGSITCQHGPWECFLNTVEACAVDAWPDVQKHFNFIYCVESLVVENKFMEWESCFQKTGLDPQAVSDCYNNGYGKKLELQYAAQTDALQPRRRYVPWVLVDGVPLYDDYRSFETYICKAYNGELPEACEGVVLTITREMKANHADRVCLHPVLPIFFQLVVIYLLGIGKLCSGIQSNISKLCDGQLFYCGNILLILMVPLTMAPQI